MSKMKEAGTCPYCYAITEEFLRYKVCSVCEAFDSAEREAFGTPEPVKIL